MRTLLIVLAVAAHVCTAHDSSNDNLVPAARTTIATHPDIGCGFETSTASLPSSSLPSPSTAAPRNDVSPAWQQSQPIGIYNYLSIGSQSTAGGDVAASTWLSSPLVEDMGGVDGKIVWEEVASDNAVQGEVRSARNGDTVVAAKWLADGYNMSGVVEVRTSESDKPLWTINVAGAGAGYGSIAMKTDGSHFAVVANVNNSFVIPGHAQVMCFSRSSSTPTHTIDLPAGQYAAQAAPTMADDMTVTFAAGTSIYIADCSTGSLLFSYDRNYVATALAMSADGMYVATAFESVLVLKRNGAKFEVHMNEPLTSGNASAPGVWVGAQVAFSKDGKLAVGQYNGYTAKQNRITVWDMVSKNLTWAYDYLDVSFQAAQDVPSAIDFTDDGHYVAVGSWGDANHTNPTVNLFCAVCGKLLMGFTTPGSVMALSVSSTPTSVRVAAGGKHVHANLMGSGGDLFVLEFVHKDKEGMQHCAGMDLDAPLFSVVDPEALNAREGMTWVAGKNERFAAATVRDAARLMGTHIDAESLRKAGVPMEPNVIEEADNDTPIPAEFSAAKAFPNCVHAVRDQQSCGSCYAFGASETLSDRYCIAAAAKGKNVSSVILSPEDIVSCDKQDYGCGGGYLYYAWQFMEDFGLVSDSCFPYTAGSGMAAACQTSCTDGTKWEPVKVKNGTLSYYGSVEQIQRAIMAGGPIEVAFNVYADFMSYKAGVYQRTPGAGLMGGHAVKMVGWGHDAVTGLDYWEIYNSWGTGWGINGTFLIRRGVNECGIEYNSIWGDVDV